MKRSLFAAGCTLVIASVAVAAPANPYAGQQDREIKALSSDEIQSYLSGKGMGFAKAAELNGYPGPSHVLALAGELGLSAEQESATKALFASMEANAVKFGRLLVEEERRLDELFATKQVSAEQLGASLSRIGALHAQVRAAHLEAHLAQAEILGAEQTARYNALRGYGSPQPASQRPGHHH